MKFRGVRSVSIPSTVAKYKYGLQLQRIDDSMIQYYRRPRPQEGVMNVHRKPKTTDPKAP